MGYVFFDTETTGLDTAFDQILQFGAILTNANFEEIDRFNIRCRLMSHVVPSPKAMLITSINSQQLLDASLPSHYEMIQAIYKRLESWPPAVFIGWNSIKFDEELLRQAFYQALHYPYLTNSQNNCRSDALRIARVISALEPTKIQVSLNDYGKPSFRLEDIATANGFEWHNLHDAIGDAEATMFLCRLMERNAPDIWSHAMKFSQKAAARSFIEEEEIFVHIPSNFNEVEPSLVMQIGESKKDKNALYVYDLSYAPESLSTLSESKLRETLAWPHKAVIPLKINASPMMQYPEDVPEHLYADCLSPEVQKARYEKIRDDEKFRNRLISIMEDAAFPTIATSFVEREIYQGFLSGENWPVARQFHAADWRRRADLVQYFPDPRLRRLALRLVLESAPHILRPEDRQKSYAALFGRLNGKSEENKRPRSFDGAIEEAKLLLKSDQHDKSQVLAIVEFLETRKNEIVFDQAT